jgi:hypothetical protein
MQDETDREAVQHADSDEREVYVTKPDLYEELSGNAYKRMIMQIELCLLRRSRLFKTELVLVEKIDRLLQVNGVFAPIRPGDSIQLTIIYDRLQRHTNVDKNKT